MKTTKILLLSCFAISPILASDDTQTEILGASDTIKTLAKQKHFQPSEDKSQREGILEKKEALTQKEQVTQNIEQILEEVYKKHPQLKDIPYFIDENGALHFSH